MPFNLIAYDQKLADNVLLKPDGIDIVDGFPPGGEEIRFQFPPTIKTETKSMLWKEWDQYAWEQGAIYLGAKARKVTLTATYLVGGPSTGKVKKWTSKIVAEEMRRWKAFFYANGTSKKTLPVFAFDMYEHIASDGPKPAFFRGKNISFKYSDTIVQFPSASGGGDISAFPLKTDVTLTMELVTNVQSDDGKSLTAHPILKSIPKQQWY